VANNSNTRRRHAFGWRNSGESFPPGVGSAQLHVRRHNTLSPLDIRPSLIHLKEPYRHYSVCGDHAHSSIISGSQSSAVGVLPPVLARHARTVSPHCATFISRIIRFPTVDKTRRAGGRRTGKKKKKKKADALAALPPPCGRRGVCLCPTPLLRAPAPRRAPLTTRTPTYSAPHLYLHTRYYRAWHTRPLFATRTAATAITTPHLPPRVAPAHLRRHGAALRDVGGGGSPCNSIARLPGTAFLSSGRDVSITTSGEGGALCSNSSLAMPPA